VNADPERAVAENCASGPRRNSPWEQVATLALALLIALGIRAFALEPFRIPSGSMFPTLLIGDHLFVNRFVYGIEIPFTDVRLPGLRRPERGEVVVFSVARDGARTYPADRRPDLPREAFVKRVVGLPGDVIRFRDGVLTVNETAVAAVPTGEWFEDEAGRALQVLEVTLGERSFRILEDPEVAPIPADALVVAEDRYFMLGDNRDYSKDSRFWGTVRFDQIRGPAFLLYWSWDFEGGWLDLLDPVTWWSTAKRWERIGARLD
jgi:signal peptidase I